MESMSNYYLPKEHKIPAGQKMKVITVATTKMGYMLALEESCERLGYELVHLGMGAKWKGFGWRIKVTLDYLRTLPPDEIFMSVDAYDIIFVKGPDAALEAFNKTKARFLCGAFRKLDGLVGVMQQQEFGECAATSLLPPPYTALCCGTWMSTAKDTIALWSQPGEIDDKADDQRILNKLFEDGLSHLPNTIQVTPDCHFQVFGTLFPHKLSRELRAVDQIKVTKDKVIYCGVTNSEPILIHGLANMNLEPLLKELGFKNTKDDTPLSYHNKKLYYHLKNMFLNSWIMQSLCLGAVIVVGSATHLLLQHRRNLNENT